MSKTNVNPTALERPPGYAHGVLSGGRPTCLFGQTGMDAAGRSVAPGPMVAQARQTAANLKALLDEAGGTMSDVDRLA